MRPRNATATPPRGVTMIEVLVAIVISVIALLGLAGFQMRTYAAEAESFQRTHAVVLLDDMASRISVNRANAAAYVQDDIGVGAVANCAALTVRAQIDLCEWGNQLRGAAETLGTSRIGAMIAARGCITQLTPQTYIVAVVWEGLAPTAAPPTTCGQNAYSSEALRRAVTTVVTIGNLG